MKIKPQSRVMRRMAIYTRHAMATGNREQATQSTRKELAISLPQARLVSEWAELLIPLVLPWRVVE